MKPIIAISPRFGATDEGDRRLELKLDYAEAISRAGGVPIIVPPCADLGALADHVDAWMVPGGGDIHPSIYGEAPHDRVYGLDPGRFAFERSLWDVWKGKPYLGICYGCQLLNVLYGGSLVQHVPDVVGHEEHGSGAVQTYTFVEGSRLHGNLGPHAQGRSYHHQSVGRVADGLCVTARAEDGIIEGVEAAGDVWHVGVQWHPETTLDSPDSQRLFAAFVRAAGGVR